MIVFFSHLPGFLHQPCIHNDYDYLAAKPTKQSGSQQSAYAPRFNSNSSSCSTATNAGHNHTQYQNQNHNHNPNPEPTHRPRPGPLSNPHSSYRGHQPHLLSHININRVNGGGGGGGYLYPRRRYSNKSGSNSCCSSKLAMSSSSKKKQRLGFNGTPGQPITSSPPNQHAYQHFCFHAFGSAGTPAKVTPHTPPLRLDCARVERCEINGGGSSKGFEFFSLAKWGSSFVVLTLLVAIDLGRNIFCQSFLRWFVVAGYRPFFDPTFDFDLF